MMNDHFINALIHCSIEARDFILTNMKFDRTEKIPVLCFDEFYFRETENAPLFLLKEPQLIISHWKEFIIVIKSYPDQQLDITTEEQLVYLTDLCGSSFTNEEVVLSGFSKDEYRWTEYRITGATASLHFKEKQVWEVT